MLMTVYFMAGDRKFITELFNQNKLCCLKQYTLKKKQVLIFIQNMSNTMLALGEVFFQLIFSMTLNKISKEFKNSPWAKSSR